MDGLLELFIVIFGSFLLYLSGYYDKRKTKELKLYDSVKAIYGKRGQPIYREASIIQTFGLILGSVWFLRFISINLGLPMLVHHIHIYRSTSIVLILAFCLDLLFDRLRQM